MKVFRMFGMFIMVTFLCVNLSSCSDDDDEKENGGNGGGIVSGSLEGTWGLTNDQGWEIYNGEKEEWNDSYDPKNPSDEDVKMVITKTGDKTYNIKWYGFYDGEWRYEEGDDGKITVDGNVMTVTYADGDEIEESKNTFSLSNNQLVIIEREEFENGSFYDKMTYIRM